MSRVTDELFIEATSTWLTLSGVNSRKTAFASVKFEIEFFQSLEVDTSTQNNNKPHCKLAMRSITPLFRGLRNVELATISLDSSDNCLKIEFICKQQMTKTHSIAILEFSRLKELKIPDRFANKIIGAHKTFGEIVTGFHNSTRELCIEVTRTSINIRNHIDNPDEDKHTIRASHQLLTGEFETFSISDSNKLSYSFPDFKAIVSFAEMIDSNLKLEFDVPGAPMRVSTRASSGSYSAMLFCATMDGDDTLNASRLTASSTQTSAASAQSQNPPPANGKVVPAQRPNGKRKTSDADPEFPIRNRKTPRKDDAVDIQQVHTEDILPQAITPDLPRDESELELRPESHEPDSQPIPALLYIEESNARTHSESNLRLNLSDKRKTVRPEPMSAEILFETESIEGNTEDTEDSIPASPRQQRLRRLFHRCFEATFQPSRLPGADIILAPNSDEETDQ